MIQAGVSYTHVKVFNFSIWPSALGISTRTSAEGNKIRLSGFEFVRGRWRSFQNSIEPALPSPRFNGGWAGYFKAFAATLTAFGGDE